MVVADDGFELDAGWMGVDWPLGRVGHALTWKSRPKSRAGERTMALDPAADEKAAHTLASVILGSE